MSTASKYAHRRPVRGGAGKASTLKDDLRVAIRFFKMAHGINKAYLPLQAAAALAGAARAFPAVIFPKLIIDELTGAQRVPVFLLLCGGFLLLTVLIEQLGTFLNTRVAIANMAMTHAFEARLGERHGRLLGPPPRPRPLHERLRLLGLRPLQVALSLLRRRHDAQRLRPPRDERVLLDRHGLQPRRPDR